MYWKTWIFQMIQELVRGTLKNFSCQYVLDGRFKIHLFDTSLFEEIEAIQLPNRSNSEIWE